MAAGTIEAARSRLARAQQALDEALAGGTATERLRAFRDTAREELEQLEDAADQTIAQAEAQRAQRLTEIAQAEMRAQAEALSRELAALAHVPAPEVHLPVGLLIAAHEAHAHLADAEQAHAAAQARVAGLEARVADLGRQRGEIVARRTAGDARPSDGADLALLDADRDGLADLLEVARSLTAAPAEHLARARAHLGEAEGRWGAAVTAARAAALLDLCRALEVALTRTAAELYRSRGQGPYWRASGELRNVLAYGRPAGVAAA
jgi:DNA repair exonuclease SbcCD ATPase subunit